MLITIDLCMELEFLSDGMKPRIEVIRDQVNAFVHGYTVAKGRVPERIVMAENDHKHCVRRIIARMQQPALHEAKEAWRERRKAGSDELWRDCRPERIKDATLHWSGIPIVTATYSRHRPVTALD